MVAASDYIAYFDETGDHGLDNIDPAFPVFVLCGWVFKIKDYLQKECPAFCAIKFNHWHAGKLPTIGFLGANATAWGPWTAAFVARLRELDWIEGRTVAIEYRCTSRQRC